MNARIVAVLLVALAVASPRAGAQAADTVVLGGVIISATKTPISPTQLSQSVTVITGEELRARGIITVADALRSVPGAAVVSTGSFGSLSSLFLRGGESRYTKFLIDGVPVNAVGGFFDLSHLTTDNVERIEIVRGSASAVHGADAVSGVVQIITRGGGGPLRATSRLRAGTYATVDAAAGLSGGGERSPFSLHAGRHSTDGILPFNNHYLNETLSGSVQLRPDAATTVSLATRGTHARFHYPTDFAGNVVDSNAYRDQRRLTLSLNLKRALGQRAQLRALAGTNDVTEFTDDVTSTSTGETRDRFTSRNRRRRAEARVGLTLPGATLTVGTEYQHERERSGSAAGPADAELVDYSRFAGTRITRAAYAEYLASVGRLRVDVGGRVDDPSDFERAITYRLGSVLEIVQGTAVRGSVSTSYNAPAFFYLLDTDYTVGNPRLSPERARNREIAVTQSLARLGSLTATLFSQTFRDLIEYVPGGPPDYKGTYANLRAATSKGWEVEVATAAYEGLSAAASYTSLTARVAELASGYQGTATVGDELVRRPRKSGSASVTFAPARGGSLTLSGRYVGRRPDFDFTEFPSPRVTLPPFTVLDFAATLPLSLVTPRMPVALTLRVDNVTDREYEETFNFAAPGRRILVGGAIGATLR